MYDRGTILLLNAKEAQTSEEKEKKTMNEACNIGKTCKECIHYKSCIKDKIKSNTIGVNNWYCEYFIQKRRAIMKVVNKGKYTDIVCTDQPGQGGACHEYQIIASDTNDTRYLHNGPFTVISFQDGPIKENSVNGCMNEDLIAIVIDRLQGFQSGEFRCRENAIALTKLEEALLWLNKRTNDRIKRGVEGTNNK